MTINKKIIFGGLIVIILIVVVLAFQSFGLKQEIISGGQKEDNFNYTFCNSNDECNLTNFPLNNCCNGCEPFPINKKGDELQEKFRRKNCDEKKNLMCANYKCAEPTYEEPACVKNKCIKKSDYLTQSAIQNKDYKICDQMKGGSRAKCLIGYAVAQKDCRVCENIMTGNTGKYVTNLFYYRDVCYKNLAIFTKDKPLCYKIGGSKDNCLLSFLIYENNGKICDEVFEQNEEIKYKESCYLNMQEKNKKIIECEKSSDKEACYYKNITGNADPELFIFCDQTGKRKNECYKTGLYFFPEEIE